MNLQVIAGRAGDILSVSGALPGAVHHLITARIWGILRQLAAAGLIVLADKGYHGGGEHIRTRIRAEQAAIAAGRQPRPPSRPSSHRDLPMAG
jgi:hypothetical protein